MEEEVDKLRDITLRLCKNLISLARVHLKIS